MSVVSENNGAWILSPYCFCEDRPWLSVDDIWEKDIDAKVNVGGGITPILGLSKDDSALLAALLTALAVFLFLLFLLLCLFCPCGLCCGKLCPCCCKAKKSGKRASQGASVGGDKIVNLTAVDMKIPRVWADGETGFSDSELGKRRKIWGETKGGQWMEYGDKYGQGNNTVLTGNVQHNRWVSDYDLDDKHGEGHQRFVGMKARNAGNKNRNSEMFALNEFYRGSSKIVPPTPRHRSNSYTSIIEKLMTPRSTGYSDYNNGVIPRHTKGIAGRDTVNYSSYDYFGRDNQDDDEAVVTMDKEDTSKLHDVLYSTAKRDVTSSAVNSKTEDSVQNISKLSGSTTTSGYDSTVDHSRAEPHVVNSVALASSTTVDKNSDFFRETGIARETSNPNYNVTMETSTYMKRVVEETETVTTG